MNPGPAEQPPDGPDDALGLAFVTLAIILVFVVVISAISISTL